MQPTSAQQSQTYQPQRQGVMPISANDSRRRRQLFWSDDVEAAISFYRRQESLPGDLLAMVAAVAQAQSDLLDALERSGTDIPRQSLPPAGWTYDAIDRVARAVGGHSPLGAEALREFAAKCRLIDTGALARAATGSDSNAVLDVAAATGVSPEVALYVLRMASQPFTAWRCGAEPASVADQAYPARSSCPACGGRPLMGKHVEPDGGRFLRCRECGNEWAFPRIACPGCKDAGQDDIESLFVHGDESHRVYLCKRCGQYFKVSDERLLGVRAYLPLEDIVTLHLDEVARQRGFSPVGEDSGRPDAG